MSISHGNRSLTSYTVWRRPLGDFKPRLRENAAWNQSHTHMVDADGMALHLRPQMSRSLTLMQSENGPNTMGFRESNVPVYGRSGGWVRPHLCPRVLWRHVVIAGPVRSLSFMDSTSVPQPERPAHGWVCPIQNSLWKLDIRAMNVPKIYPI